MELLHAQGELAYHEAGHAVAAWRLGVPFERVNLVPDPEDGREGGLKWDPERLLHVPTKAILAIHVICAGSAAEALARRCGFNCVWLSTGSRSDLCLAVKFAERVSAYSVGEPAAHLREASRGAHQLVVRESVRVERVAAALADRCELSSEEVVTICELASVASKGNERTQTFG